MRCTGSRWCRAAAAVLLLMGALLVCGPGAAAAQGAPVATAGSAVTAGPGEETPWEQAPGCDPLDDEGGLAPAVPPRPVTAAELLPPPHTGTRLPADRDDPAVAAVRPERAPPWLSGPSPVDLSVLRV